MLDPIKRIVKRLPFTVIAYGIFQNWREGRRVQSGNFEAAEGATHLRLSVTESVAYVDAVFADYLRYSGLSTSDLAGKRVLEVGPGDNLGVALRFLAGGAREVVCLDRFYAQRDLEQQRAIYAAIRRTMPASEQATFDRVIGGDGVIKPDSVSLTYRAGVPIEEAPEAFGLGSFDLIVSRAVLEHVRDSDRALAAMDRLLEPSGLMLHKIDFRDHGTFTSGGHHPLTFLTISDRMYDAMSSHGARPNRRLIDYYREKLRELGYNAKLFVTGLLTSPEELIPAREHVTPGVDYSRSDAARLLGSIRPRLLPRYRELSDQDLLVTGIFLVAKKCASSS